MDRHRPLLKLLIVGDSGTGKTALLNRYVHNKFSQQYRATIGVDFATKETQLGEETVVLQLWDPSSPGVLRLLGVPFCRGAVGCLLIYDVTSRSSFQGVEEWKEKILMFQKPTFPFVLVGNKADLQGERQVRWSEGQTWARSIGNMPMLEVSAKEGNSVKEALEEVARLALVYSQLHNRL